MPVVRKLNTVGGGSRSVVLPKPFLDQINLDEHAEVELNLKGNAIVITSHRYAGTAEFKTVADKVFEKRRGLMKRLAKR